MLLFFLNDTATTEIYTLPLHAALPISAAGPSTTLRTSASAATMASSVHLIARGDGRCWPLRSEEHTSELQSRLHLVCRLLLEKKKNQTAREACATARDDAPRTTFDHRD